jgi:hypothetical protein
VRIVSGCAVTQDLTASGRRHRLFLRDAGRNCRTPMLIQRPRRDGSAKRFRADRIMRRSPLQESISGSVDFRQSRFQAVIAAAGRVLRANGENLKELAD